MKFFLSQTFLLILITLPGHTLANERFLGSWESSSGTKFHIVNGFRSGLGPVLIQEPDGEIITTNWIDEGGKFQITYGWTDYNLSLISKDAALLTSDYSANISLIRSEDPDESNQIDIKQQSEGFVDALVAREWITPLGDLVFKSTFSEDSGVATTSTSDKPVESVYWAVSSDILKFGDALLLEAKITNEYLVALDEYDNFIVFKSLSDAPSLQKTNLESEKEKFFNLLLSGEWYTEDYSGKSIYKFRPVFGDLSGILFQTQNDQLISDMTWEYSPSSGTLDLGYYKYPGAVIVNNTLAFKDVNGDQYFYNRYSEGPMKRFTLSDVTTIPLNEFSVSKVKDGLNMQLQRGDHLHLFEFQDDGLKGFVHQYRSSEFEISGETMSNAFINDANKLFKVEDFVIFNSDWGPITYKMDASESRLKPKSDSESVIDAQKQELLKSTHLDKRLIVRIKSKDGTTIDVPLPIRDFGDIGTLTLVRE